MVNREERNGKNRNVPLDGFQNKLQRCHFLCTGEAVVLMPLFVYLRSCSIDEYVNMASANHTLRRVSTKIPRQHCV